MKVEMVDKYRNWANGWGPMDQGFIRHGSLVKGNGSWDMGYRSQVMVKGLGIWSLVGSEILEIRAR